MGFTAKKRMHPGPKRSPSRWKSHTYNVYAEALVSFWPNRERRRAKLAAERRARKHLLHARKVRA